MVWIEMLSATNISKSDSHWHGCQTNENPVVLSGFSFFDILNFVEFLIRLAAYTTRPRQRMVLPNYPKQTNLILENDDFMCSTKSLQIWIIARLIACVAIQSCFCTLLLINVRV